MPTNIRVRESTENIPAGRRVRDVSNTIFYLDPKENPFTLLTTESGRRQVTNSKYEHLEKELPDKVSQVLGAQTAADTAIEVTAGHAQRFFIADIVLNAKTNEVFRVTAVNTTTDVLTVVRGVGSVAAAAMATLEDLIIIGNANAEGGALGVERSVQETIPFNYSQILRQPFGTTGTEAASENYGGKDKTRLRMEHAVYHAIEIERNLIFGQRNIDTSDTGKPIRYTGGFLYWVTTNVQDMGAVTTEPEMETFCETVFAATGSGQTRFLFAAPKVVSVIDQLAAGRLHVVPSDKTYGIEVMQWLTSHGTLMIIKHRLLVNGPGGTGFGGHALAVDKKNLQYAYLRDRDTKLRVDVGTPGDDGFTDEYLTECGLDLILEKAHGVMKGVVA